MEDRKRVFYRPLFVNAIFRPLPARYVFCRSIALCMCVFLCGVEKAASASPSATSIQSDLQARLDAQNALFNRQYDSDMRNSPEDETAAGNDRDNAKLDDYSIAAAIRNNKIDQAYRKSLAAISTEGFSEQDRISHELLLRELDRRTVAFELKTYEMPISQMRGLHTSLAELPGFVPLDSVRHYEDYIDRLHQIPVAFQQTIGVLRQGERDQLMPPRFLLEKIPAQCTGIITENPFIKPAQIFPASISPTDRARLAGEIKAVVSSEVLPAYRNFADFIARDYAPKGRSQISIGSLPNGARRYQAAIHDMTTTAMSPSEIQALGLHEVSRIDGLLGALAHKAGYADLASFRTALKHDPRYIPTSAEQIVADFRHYVEQMRSKLPLLFDNYPPTRLVVEAAPASEGMGTHHVDGSPDGSRPGRVVVAISDFAHRSLISDETQAYHEGIPGHELQISIQQRLKNFPRFRSEIRNDAYVEGWAVYAEALGKEVGFFQDLASDYGRLNLELMRAVRLVIDPGIHAQGWTRDQAVAYFRASGAADEPTIQSEVDRYIAWPAQSLSYKIGQLKILDLRHLAEERLGARFDIKEFHDAVLGAGSLPLDMLDARVRAWVDSQAARGRSVSSLKNSG